MSPKIRPIARDYDPGYPAMIEVQDWRALLERSSRAVFEPRTLAFAGLLGTSLLIPAPAQADRSARMKDTKPIPAELKAGNAAAAAIANKALADVSGQAMWKGASGLLKQGYVAGNPDITVPRIPISFGNSMIGVFDLNRARTVTAEIFRAYGLEPQADYPLKREGFEFHVDGYDPKAGIGFEIVGGERPPQGFARPKPVPPTPDSALLDDAEQERVMSAVEGKALRLLMVPVGSYPNMDGDQYTPLAAYLRSVLDYLDWLKVNGQL